MDAFPAYVPLENARVVVAGDGPAAEAKARLFSTSPAEIVRLSGPSATARDAYAGARLAFIAGEGAWLEAAVAAARGAGAWVNAVDRPDLCDFNTPSIVDRGRVVGAVGTTGSAPVLAVSLRQEIEARWPEHLDSLAALMAALRPDIIRGTTSWSARRRALRALLRGPWTDAALRADIDQARTLASEALARGELEDRAGSVTFIARPDQPDLLTLRDVRAINQADVVLYRSDTSPELLAHARRDASFEPWSGDEGRLGEVVCAGGLIVVVGHAGPGVEDAAAR